MFDGLEAQPAELVLAMDALHPVATPSLLDERHAFWALLGIVDQPQHVLHRNQHAKPRELRSEKKSSQGSHPAGKINVNPIRIEKPCQRKCFLLTTWYRSTSNVHIRKQQCTQHIIHNTLFGEGNRTNYLGFGSVLCQKLFHVCAACRKMICAALEAERLATRLARDGTAVLGLDHNPAVGGGAPLEVATVCDEILK